MLTTIKEVNRYPELDALRGIAALIVVLFHYTINRQEAELGFKLGVTGVDLFFIISGFVIFMSINNVQSSTDFIINRVSRLYPTYWAAVTFTFILIIAHSIFKNREVHVIDFINYLGNMTMFQYYLRVHDIDEPYWTMIIEMLFYLTVLLLFKNKLLKYVNTIGLIVSLLTVSVNLFYGENVIVKIIIKTTPLIVFAPLFFAGIVFFKQYKYNYNPIKNYSIIILCFICQSLLYNYSGKSHYFISQSEYIIMLLSYFLLFTLFINNKLKFIVSKTTLFLGKISYPLYLTHQYVSLSFVIPILTTQFHMNFGLAIIGFALPINILIATLITRYVEFPFSRIMKEKLRKKYLS